jgi:hypothetical protein
MCPARPMVRSILAWLVVVALAASSPARAQELGPEARRKYEQGMALYRARDFAAAARALGEAYALEPRRDVLFAQAQATRLAGNCAAALPLYQQFLNSDPPEQQVAATRIALARCESAPERPAPPPVIVASPPPVPPSVPIYRDLLGGALLASGLVTAGVGGVLMASAHAQNDTAAVQGGYPEYASRRASAEGRWRLGVGAVVAGAALVAGGCGRYLWVWRHGLGVGGRF